MESFFPQAGLRANPRRLIIFHTLTYLPCKGIIFLLFFKEKEKRRENTPKMETQKLCFPIYRERMMKLGIYSMEALTVTEQNNTLQNSKYRSRLGISQWQSCTRSIPFHKLLPVPSPSTLPPFLQITNSNTQFLFYQSNGLFLFLFLLHLLLFSPLPRLSPPWYALSLFIYALLLLLRFCRIIRTYCLSLLLSVSVFAVIYY